jgi:4-aminobutyrate aminotransferase/(S)-3-amino-2-methylpropionate transaminase
VAHPDETAAIFVEPIQQVGGVVSPPDEYLARLRRLCDQKGILFVDDEVAVGFGRTGKMFAIDHWGVVPDVMFLGKAFANGLAMAGIIAKKEIMETEAENAVVRAGSYEGNPISCVSALATIEEIQQKKLVENSAKVGEYMLKRLREISQEHELVGEVRGRGLMIGIELIKDHKSKKPAVEETQKTVNEAFKRGLLATRIGIYRHIIRLTPPLILSKEDSDIATEIIDDALREARKRS